MFRKNARLEVDEIVQMTAAVGTLSKGETVRVIRVTDSSVTVTSHPSGAETKTVAPSQVRRF